MLCRSRRACETVLLEEGPVGQEDRPDGWAEPGPRHVGLKNHVIILPKYRRKVLYGRRRRGLGPILRDLCRPKEIELVEGEAMPDHIPMDRPDDRVPEGHECDPDPPGVVAHERSIREQEKLRRDQDQGELNLD
jgi:hypothetical protein